MNMTSLMHEQSILIPCTATDKKSAIEAMVDALERSGALTDKAAYLEAVLAREATGSTGIGFGVAIPHGKSSGAGKPALAFAKFSQPIDWNSLDGEPVQAAFMIAVPQEAAGNEHLKILIAISRKMIDEQFRSQLLEADNAEQLDALLQTI
jgi:fructose-specific phosphotransferase system IIA component